MNDQDFEEFKFRPPPITGTLEERCQSALEHVASGLQCVKYFPSEPQAQEAEEEEHKCSPAEVPAKGKHEYDEATANMAKPFQAIPMPYAPLHPWTTNELVDASADGSPR